jgi:hypothetical protein
LSLGSLCHLHKHKLTYSKLVSLDST